MRSKILTVVVLVFATFAHSAYATNGDTLIGVAPASRAMGGTGVAAPQDAVSAVFANPAAICMGPFCPGSQAVFAATLYDPTTRATVVSPAGTFSVKSGTGAFIIPSVGLVTPLTERLRFGIGAFGVSGMGVDYRNKGVNLAGTPGDGDIYTQLQIMKFAPNIAYLVTPNFSVGTSLHLVYGSLDLGQGAAPDYAFGVQFGAIYKLDDISLGLTYTTPEGMTHRRVTDYGSGNAVAKKWLKLESPQNVAAGVAWHATDRLLLEADVKWLNWSDADGYREFDWQDQWVYAVGAQYKDPKGLCLRVGYNYAKSPLRMHNNFDYMGSTMLQGNSVPTVLYEYLRIVGFPAIAEHHFTASIGYRLSDSFEAHLGYMYALNKKVREQSKDGLFAFGSELREVSYDAGLLWKFF